MFFKHTNTKERLNLVKSTDFHYALAKKQFNTLFMSVQMLYAVGSNSNGQLGVNSTEESSVLFAHVKNGMLAGGNTISLLHSWGFYSTFMIEAPSKSQIICGAGDNEFSLLSTEKHIPTLPEFEPIDMQGVVSSKRPLVKFLACGTHHSVLCTTDNRIYAKGYNEVWITIEFFFVKPCLP